MPPSRTNQKQASRGGSHAGTHPAHERAGASQHPPGTEGAYLGRRERKTVHGQHTPAGSPTRTHGAPTLIALSLSMAVLCCHRVASRCRHLSIPLPAVLVKLSRLCCNTRRSAARPAISGTNST